MAGRGCLQRTTPAQTRLIEQVLCSDAYSLTYVGAVGRGLLRVTDLFNPNKDFRFVWLTTNSATWDYPCSASQVRAASGARITSVGLVYVVTLDGYCLNQTRLRLEIPRFSAMHDHPNLESRACEVPIGGDRDGEQRSPPSKESLETSGKELAT